MQSILTATISCLSLVVVFPCMSQNKVEGEYYFRQMEIVSGFNFKANGTFEFFYSYGAVDRSATGTFTIAGDILQLKSDKQAGKDFTTTGQYKEGQGYELTFNSDNKYLIQNIIAVFTGKGKRQQVYTNDDGKISFNLFNCDTIYVQHTLFPDIFTLVKDKSNNNNRFILSLNPSLEEVSFKGIDFKIENDSTLTCLPNYLLPIDNIKFIKQ